MISIISLVVVAVIAGAMVVVLSAFNGIEDLVNKMYSVFDAELTILPAQGKTIDLNTLQFEQFDENASIAYYSPVIQEDVMLRSTEKPTVATLKGVYKDYNKLSRMDTTVVQGEYLLEDDNYFYGVLGYAIKADLRITVQEGMPSPISVFAPKRGANFRKDKEQAFNREIINVAGVYSINAELDSEYLLTSFAFAADLFDYQNQCSHIELSLTPDSDVEEVRNALQQDLGADYLVRTKQERNSLIYETNQTEKKAIYIIMIFILIIAAFNIMASLTMLILEKRKDIATLRSLGTTLKDIRSIFFYEGLLINGFGVFVGVSLGLLLCFAQIQFGLVPLQNGTVEFYPIKVLAKDLLFIVGAVLSIGTLSSYLLVRYLVKRLAV